MPGNRWGSEKKVLDERARQSAPGSFVRLSRGNTHYEECGPRDARPVVLIHGFLVPYFIWDPTVQALRGAGVRAIRYDQYGRGFSDRPEAAYNMTLFVEQLTELIDALACQEVDLVGLSMGGPISATFAVTRPERVGRIVLIDPSGVGTATPGALRLLSLLPGAAAVLTVVSGTGHVLEMIAADFYDPAQVGVFREQCRKQMEYRGFARAVISAVSHGMLDRFESTYAELGTLQKDILIIWGENDPTIPFRHSKELLGLLPRAQLLPIPRSGHVPHVERPDVVNPRLIEFLSQAYESNC